VKHVARKRFGQNFLIDRAVIDQIVAAIAPQAGECMVEIGPGLGALTEPLIEALGGTPLHVVELDRDLAAALRERFDAKHLVMHQADALRFDVASIGGAPRAVRVVGNLPYNISSPLLFHLLEASALIRDQHFMLQREVVERMVASPGSRVYGRLSVMLQVRYEMELLFVVGPGAFQPAPKVDSALVRMRPAARLEFALSEPLLFAALVAQAFSTRRKMLRNTLAEFNLRVPMDTCGIDGAARAEDLAPGLYVAYANALATAASARASS
jgi:16S rRNA (adenine1518-N6/adenine1519-N6)-dimethyltransferase